MAHLKEEVEWQTCRQSVWILDFAEEIYPEEKQKDKKRRKTQS